MLTLSMILLLVFVFNFSATKSPSFSTASHYTTRPIVVTYNCISHCQYSLLNLPNICFCRNSAAKLPTDTYILIHTHAKNYPKYSKIQPIETVNTTQNVTNLLLMMLESCHRNDTLISQCCTLRNHVTNTKRQPHAPDSHMLSWHLFNLFCGPFNSQHCQLPRRPNCHA